MGRPSKLSEKQWKALEARLLAGEKAADLAREFGVSPTAISSRVSKRVSKVKSVATQLVEAEQAVKALPISEQVSVFQLADELRAISRHLAGAGKFGAATAHRLNGIAHAKVQEIDDAAPLNADSVETLKGIAVLTRLANDASTIGLNLLSANKDMAKRAAEDEPVMPVRVVVQVEDASTPEPKAQ